MFILMEPHKNSNAHRIRQAVLKMFAHATPNLSIRKWPNYGSIDHCDNP